MLVCSDHNVHRYLNLTICQLHPEQHAVICLLGKIHSKETFPRVDPFMLAVMGGWNARIQNIRDGNWKMSEMQ